MEQTAALQVLQRRSALHRTRRCLQEGKLTIGFLGGSITDPRGTSWAEPVISWFVKTFPQVQLTIENAAIGATGSDLAIFRVERDILRYDCDLVFVEYAVNDTVPSETFRRSREGLLRKLLADSSRDVILTYTFGQGMYKDMINNRVPDTVAEFEALAEHYGLSSVWMGLHSLRDVMAGGMRWEEWLPDGLHPDRRGAFSYGQSVIALLEKEVPGESVVSEEVPHRDLPAPLVEQNWQHTAFLSFDDVQREGPWVIRRYPYLAWIDQVLSTDAVGARLAFSFHGRGLALGFDFGKNSAEFTYRLDGGAWETMIRERPDWYVDNRWYRLSLLADDLPMSTHTFELEVIHGDRSECTGTNFSLAFIGLLL